MSLEELNPLATKSSHRKYYDSSRMVNINDFNLPLINSRLERENKNISSYRRSNRNGYENYNFHSKRRTAPNSNVELCFTPQNSSVSKPFLVGQLSDYYKPDLTRLPSIHNPDYIDYIDNELDYIFPNHVYKDFVEEHSKGFKNKNNEDLMKHFVRLYMANKFIFDELKKVKNSRKYRTKRKDEIHEKFLSDQKERKKYNLMRMKNKKSLLDKMKKGITFMNDILSNSNFKNFYNDQKNISEGKSLLNFLNSPQEKLNVKNLKARFPISNKDSNSFREKEFLIYLENYAKKDSTNNFSKFDFETIKEVIDIRAKQLKIFENDAKEELRELGFNDEDLIFESFNKRLDFSSENQSNLSFQSLSRNIRYEKMPLGYIMKGVLGKFQKKRFQTHRTRDKLRNEENKLMNKISSKILKERGENLKFQLSNFHKPQSLSLMRSPLKENAEAIPPQQFLLEKLGKKENYFSNKNLRSPEEKIDMINFEVSQLKTDIKKNDIEMYDQNGENPRFNDEINQFSKNRISLNSNKNDEFNSLLTSTEENISRFSLSNRMKLENALEIKRNHNKNVESLLNEKILSENDFTKGVRSSKLSYTNRESVVNANKDIISKLYAEFNDDISEEDDDDDSFHQNQEAISDTKNDRRDSLDFRRKSLSPKRETIIKPKPIKKYKRWKPKPIEEIQDVYETIVDKFEKFEYKKNNRNLISPRKNVKSKRNDAKLEKENLSQKNEDKSLMEAERVLKNNEEPKPKIAQRKRARITKSLDQKSKTQKSKTKKRKMNSTSIKSRKSKSLPSKKNKTGKKLKKRKKIIKQEIATEIEILEKSKVIEEKFPDNASDKKLNSLKDLTEDIKLEFQEPLFKDETESLKFESSKKISQNISKDSIQELKVKKKKKVKGKKKKKVKKEIFTETINKDEQVIENKDELKESKKSNVRGNIKTKLKSTIPKDINDDESIKKIKSISTFRHIRESSRSSFNSNIEIAPGGELDFIDTEENMELEKVQFREFNDPSDLFKKMDILENPVIMNDARKILRRDERIKEDRIDLLGKSIEAKIHFFQKISQVDKVFEEFQEYSKRKIETKEKKQIQESLLNLNEESEFNCHEAISLFRIARNLQPPDSKSKLTPLKFSNQIMKMTKFRREIMGNSINPIFGEGNFEGLKFNMNEDDFEEEVERKKAFAEESCNINRIKEEISEIPIQRERYSCNFSQDLPVTRGSFWKKVKSKNTEIEDNKDIKNKLKRYDVFGKTKLPEYDLKSFWKSIFIT